MCVTAVTLMLTQYVRYSRKFKAQIICVIQQRVSCSHNLLGTADSLMLTLYVGYIRQFNAETICVVQKTV